MVNKTVMAHAASAATLVAGYVIAFIPAFGKEQKLLITIGTIVFAAVILLAHAVRSRPAGQSVITATENELKSVLSTYDFGPAVQKEIAKLLVTNQPAAQSAGTTTPPATAAS